MTMQTVQWRGQLRTGDEAYCRGHIVRLVERVPPDNWQVTGGNLPGVWNAQAHELTPIPGKPYAANEGRDPRLCYPDGKAVKVGDLVRVTAAHHKAAQGGTCEVERIYQFGQIGLRQGKSTWSLQGSMLEFVGRKSEGELPPVDDGAQPMPDVDADLVPVTEFRPVKAPVMDETFARSRANHVAKSPMWELKTPPREVTVEEMQAAELALAEMRAKKDEMNRQDAKNAKTEDGAHVEATEAAPVVVASEPPAREEEVTAGPVTVLSLGQIRVDGGTQARMGVNWDTVSDYAELMAEGNEFPPVIVYFDGAEYWLADGFHRYHAAKQLALAELAVDVRKGDARAARLHAAGANATHGLPRTNEDKRRAVLLLLNDPEWAQWSDREIARQCAVGHPLVARVRATLSGTAFQIGEKTVQRGGQTYTQNTAGISAANAERAAKPAPEPANVVAPAPAADDATRVYVDVQTGEIVTPALIDQIDPVTAEVTQVVVAFSPREALHSSQSNEWFTPKRYLDAARAVMGGIDLDPASCEAANRNVQAVQFFSIEDDGLAQEWHGRVWLNPPYGKEDGESNQARWIAKLLAEFEAGRVPQAIVLVNAATANEWFKRLWDFPICFTDHRIRFLSPDGVPQDSPTNGNAFVYLATDDDWNLDFAEQFRQFGPVVMETVR